jgi:hypothetical protein
MQRATGSQGELWWLTTPKGSSRQEIADYQKRITREQAARGFPQYSAWIFETRPLLHAHIVFLGNRDIADRLGRSRLCTAAKVELVPSIGGLKKYLAKERTPQAGYKRRDLGGRIRGASPARWWRSCPPFTTARARRHRGQLSRSMEAHQRQTISSAQRLPTSPIGLQGP